MNQQPSGEQPLDAAGGKQIQIRIKDEDLKGFYSNLVQVRHTQEEFTIDFFNVVPPTGIMGSRIILSPGHMKRLIAAFEDNIKRYEEQFGKVEPAAEPERKIGFDTDTK